nr:EOG090X0508 [Cyclestheria hislopi]
MPFKRQRRKKKKNKNKKSDEPEEIKNAPHSFVIYRGHVGNYIEELMKDFRRVMEPNTASSLKVSDRNSIKDYISISGPLHVSHLVMFTRSEISPYVRFCRLPHGPTLTFKIVGYSLCRDVISIQKRQHTYDKQFLTHPLVVLNNFSGEGFQLKLMTSMFQNLFPSINVATVKLGTIRRCVLFNYFPEDGSIEFRHYSIKSVPVGVSKAVKRLVQSKVPNLAKYSDISEFITKSGQLSDSEVEDDPANQVTLPQSLGSRGSKAGSQSAIRLVELGPRLRLQLVKIEEGILDGEILYHQFIHKTDEEKKLIRQRREQRRKEKEKARKIQEANIKKKEEEKARLKEKSLEGIRKKRALSDVAQNEEAEADAENDEDDAEWYRREVGQEPDKGLFSAPRKSGKIAASGGPAAKRAKFEKQKMARNKDKQLKRENDQSFKNRKTSGKKPNENKKVGFSNKFRVNKKEGKSKNIRKSKGNFKGRQKMSKKK